MCAVYVKFLSMESLTAFKLSKGRFCVSFGRQVWAITRPVRTDLTGRGAEETTGGGTESTGRGAEETTGVGTKSTGTEMETIGRTRMIGFHIQTGLLYF